MICPGSILLCKMHNECRFIPCRDAETRGVMQKEHLRIKAELFTNLQRQGQRLGEQGEIGGAIEAYEQARILR